MQASKIIEMLNDAGVKWKVGQELIEPNEDALQLVLDNMAGMLYVEPVGTQLTVAGLLMEKRELGHDLYVYTGNYE